MQITAAESIGVEGRGGYYQEAGALRDMIQNHLLQVMATVAMEPSRCSSPMRCAMSAPNCCGRSRSCGRKKCDLYAVAGQYKGFRQEPGVNPDAQTDTYAAATFFVDNWRWAGVPFFIRTRQEAAQAGDRDRDSVQPGPARAVSAMAERRRCRKPGPIC